MTVLSLNFRQAAYAQETEKVLIALVTITHDDLASDILLSSDPTQRLTAYTTDSEIVYGTTSNGDDYIFLPMRIRLPDDTDDGPGEMQIEIDNVHKTYIETIRELTSPAIFSVDLVLSDDLDTIEASWPDFVLSNINYNSAVITGSLKLETLEREPFPRGHFTPSYFPGLF
jgi:hypothetical protein